MYSNKEKLVYKGLYSVVDVLSSCGGLIKEIVLLFSMYTHNLDPVLVSLFGVVDIRWYSLAYLFGAVFSLWWMLFLKKKGEFEGLSSDDIWDLVLYLLIGVLVGSRLFMVFWNPSVYLFRPWELLFVWKGGMSFHGGLVGIIVAGLVYCRLKKVSFYSLADAMSFPTIIALALGRVANFINGELVGRVFDGFGCVVFPEVDSNCRHPWAIYAAIQRFLVGGWLFGLSYYRYFRGRFAPGFLFWNFVFFDGLGRFVLDFYRLEDLYIGLSLGQWFSLIMVLVAGYFLMFRYLLRKKEARISDLLGLLKGGNIEEAKANLKRLREKSGEDFKRKRKALFKR